MINVLKKGRIVVCIRFLMRHLTCVFLISACTSI